MTSGWRDDGQERWLADHGVRLIRGAGRLAGERLVTVGVGPTIRARRAVVLATGSSAALPPLGTSRVTLVEGLPRLLPREEPFAGEQLLEAFTREGIDVRLGTVLAAIRRDGSDGPLHATLADGEELLADEVLSATVAVAARLSLADLQHAVPAFPTVAEVWPHALEAAGF